MARVQGVDVIARRHRDADVAVVDDRVRIGGCYGDRGRRRGRRGRPALTVMPIIFVASTPTWFNTSMVMVSPRDADLARTCRMLSASS